MNNEPNAPDYVKVAQGGKAMILVMGPLVMLTEATQGLKDMTQGKEYWSDFAQAAEIGAATLAAVGLATLVEKLGSQASKQDI